MPSGFTHHDLSVDPLFEHELFSVGDNVVRRLTDVDFGSCKIIVYIDTVVVVVVLVVYSSNSSSSSSSSSSI